MELGLGLEAILNVNINMNDTNNEAKRLSVKEFRARENLETSADWNEFINDCAMELTAPPLCSKCLDYVEVDGTCQHGHPSVLMVLGLG